MARKRTRSRDSSVGVDDYRFDATRKNNPPVGLANYEPSTANGRTRAYAYDPHLSPQLVWSGKSGLTAIALEDAPGVEVEITPLHVHERVSTRAIIDAARRPEPKQLGIFADPQLPLSEAIKFYTHDIDWTNRLILGDSLVVMNSLIERELMAGKVQTIYFDPPYGVDYKSNFQPRIDQRDVGAGDDSLTREPETIKAYRDTWTLKTHSYLTYLRDRLRLSRDLLAETGSIFLQIGDENVHRVRLVMDEIFGPENVVVSIVLKKKGATTPTDPVNDFILWYAKDRSQLKVRQLFSGRRRPDDDPKFNTLIGPAGDHKRIGQLSEPEIEQLLMQGYRYARVNYPIVSQHLSATRSKDFVWNDKSFSCGSNAQWRYDPEIDMPRLAEAGRLFDGGGKSLGGVVFWEDWPYVSLSNVWNDLHGDQEPIYVVQTNRKAVARCLLMTSDPGDLVFDPTCGSGTTAFVAEQLGRRWITCDTSRVSLALARQRLLTATFPFYRLMDPERISAGFELEKARRITLKSVAQNSKIDAIIEHFTPLIGEAEAQGQSEEVQALRRRKQAEIDRTVAGGADEVALVDRPRPEPGVVRVSGPFTVEAIPPAVVSVHTVNQDQEPNESCSAFNERSNEIDVTVAGGVTTPDDETATMARLVAMMQRDGVTFPGNRRLVFKSLRESDAGVLHAEGEPVDEGNLNRVAVSFGPQNGAVSLRQVEEGIRAAHLAGYDAVIFAGFAFQAEAQQAIADITHPRVKVFMSHIRPDVMMTDARGQSLLKTTANAQLFSVFGEPDIELQREDGGNFIMALRGVDVYDPLTGQVHSANAGRIAAWFLDTDYDARCFAICQAFFPNKSAWKNLKRELRGLLDSDRFDQLTGNVSFPFKPGQHRRVAAKVIDQRGNEVKRVLSLDQGAWETSDAARL